MTLSEQCEIISVCLQCGHRRDINERLRNKEFRMHGILVINLGRLDLVFIRQIE